MVGASQTGRQALSDAKGGVTSVGLIGPDRDVAAPRLVKMRTLNVVLLSFLGMVSLLRLEVRLVAIGSISLFALFPNQ